MVGLQMRGKGARSNDLVTASAYSNQDDRAQLHRLAFFLLLRNASVEKEKKKS